jgi:2-hydroxychromene-2-carboxylate isomerase
LKEPTEKTAHDDRGTQHRRIRGEYHANDIQRYAPHKLTDIYRQTDCQFADMGLLWLQHALRASEKVIDGYVQRVFAHLWKDDGAIESARDIEPLLFAADDLQAEFFETNFDKNKFDKKHFGKTQLGAANFGTTSSSGGIHSERTGREAELSKLWTDYARSQGLEDLDGARRAAQSESINMAPTFSLGSEPFQGRAHFPLITARLKAGI